MDRNPDDTAAAPDEPPEGHEVWARLFELQDENEALKEQVRLLAGFAQTLMEEAGLVSV